MPKEKTPKVSKETKEERQIKVLEANVRELFDRIPQGSLSSSGMHDLIDKINKA